MRLTLLGTTSMLPTKQRAHSAHFLEYKGDGILFDCGEGTQRQMLLAGLNRQKTRILCLSHWHGDHAAGLLGLLQSVTRDQQPDDPPITLIGPSGSTQYYHHLSHCMATAYPFNVEIIEIDAPSVRIAMQTEDYRIYVCNLDHVVPTLGFAFEELPRRNISKEWLDKKIIEPGPYLRKLKDGITVEVEGRTITPEEVTYQSRTRRFTYIADTRLCQGAVELADHADLLLCEATHLNENAEMAHDHFHMTARRAAEVARAANCRRLVLTHFSQRYPNTEQHVAEAKEIFPNVIAGEDFMSLEIN